MATNLANMKDSDLQKWTDIVAKTHKEQAIWFLNGMWGKGIGPDKAEDVWKFVLLYNDLDIKKRADGCSLDELNAHIFLEKLKETMTVKEFRDKLREIGWVPRPMMFPLMVYLLLKYNADWHMIVNAEQGGSEALRKAQEALAEVNKTIQAIEDKKAALEKEAAGTGVKAGRAKAELAALLSGDNTELNRALLTAEAAVRKAQKEGGGGAGGGALWWIDRELTEAKKYKPKSKQ